jgi:hypothetical protein
MGKSYVRVERKKCMVCGSLYLTGAVLVHRERPDKPQVREWGMCHKHQALKNRNLIALVEVEPTKSHITERDFQSHMEPQHAYRTGIVVWMDRAVFASFFLDDPPDTGVCYVPTEVIALLQRFAHLLQGREDN